MNTQDNIFTQQNTGLLDSFAFIAFPTGEVNLFFGLHENSKAAEQEFYSKDVTSGNYKIFSPSFYRDDSWKTHLYYKHKLVYSRDEALVLIEQALKLNSAVAIEEAKKLVSWRELLSEPLSDELSASYKSSFEMIMKAIEASEISKAVPTLRVECEGRQTLTAKLLMLRNILLALQTGIQSYGYAQWDQEAGFIGLTPEVLYEKKNDKYYSMALAGTMARVDETSLEKILIDEKNNIEHQFVVDDILAKLEKTQARMQISSRKVLSFGSLLHLKTDIDFTFAANSQPTAEKLIAVLHPTAALGLFSKIYDYEWMLRLPCQQNRKKFGAPLYFKIDDNHEIALVTLRNIQWDQSTVQVEAGGGVVRSSQLASELDELQKKRNVTMRLILG